MLITCNRFTLDLSRPKIMGIVNVTPDSFSDGGRFIHARQAIAHAQQLLEDGADILDIGGESTRPNAQFVPPETEWARLEPILKELATWRVPISVDTRKTWVMQRILAHGYADLINDVQSLQDTGATELLAGYPEIAICLMHMQGLPENMQNQPHYQDVVDEVLQFFQQRIHACQQSGIAKQRLILDIGLGFGKNLTHNLTLLQRLDEIIKQTGLPMLIGASRKRMIGELTQQDSPPNRVSGSVACALAAIAKGAHLVRVHDVRATADALKVWQAIF